MLQVLQKSLDNCLNLYSDDKEQTTPVAHMTIVGLCSQPVDHVESFHHKQVFSDIGEYYLTKCSILTKISYCTHVFALVCRIFQ